MDALVAIVAVICGPAFPLAAAAVLLGWPAPLIMGITRRRAGRGGGGLIVAGGAWGVVAIGIIAWLCYTFATLSSRFTPETFDPARYSGETGQIIMARQGPCGLTLSPDRGGRMLRLSSEDGRFTAPAGRYRVASWELRATDQEGRQWSLTGRPGYDRPEQRGTLDVSSTIPARIDLKLPLRASINADVGGETISMGFVLSDGAGGQYTISSGGRDDPPGFEMLDGTGRVVLTGDFEYG